MNNTHRLRTRLQDAGIALMSSGSYVERKFTPEAEEVLRKLEKDGPPKMEFDEANEVIVTFEGAQGSLPRLGHLSKDGKFVRYHKVHGGGILPLKGVFPLTVVSAREFVAHLAKHSHIATVKVKQTQVQITGFLAGTLDRLYSAILYPLKGKIAIKDIETKSNDYNAAELVSVAGTTDDAAKRKTLSTLFGLTDGIKSSKGIRISPRRAPATK